MKNRASAMSLKGKMIGVIVAILFAAAGFSAFSLSAYAAAGDVPAHSKTIDGNGDGTYKIELTVTGDSDDETLNNSHVNVLIVYDESSSMSNGAGNGYSRADNAENAVYTFVNGLVGYQARGVDIAMAEVGFGTGVNTRQNWTTSLTTIRGHYDQGLDGNVNGSSHGNYGYNGTNWAQALDRADTLLDGLDNVGGQDRSAYPTFVILVTDGAPTASPGNQTTVPGPNVNWINYRPHYRAAVDDARSIQSRENTTLYGIYAFGTDANLLDDLMYYANTGNHRVINNVNINTTNNQNAYNFGNDDGADNYYTAANPQALDDAIAEIFNVIVQAMGITDVSMSDGTTNQVSTSSGEVVELLEVDEDSYQYWMTIPLDANNQFKRTKNVDGSAETITYTVNGSTITWTEGGASKSVTLDGSVENHQFKFEWTKDDFPNDFYEYAPEDAELVNGAVDWDLSNVDVLLDGVTYSVTFDVYPSQEALDYKARLDNGEAYEDVVPEEARAYFKADGSLETNTEATLTYSDTRLDNPGPKTTGYDNPPAVKTESSPMKVEKEWEGDDEPTLDDGLDVEVLADGDEENPFYIANLQTPDWSSEFNISFGLIKDGEVLKGSEGHDFSFAELGSEQWRWELEAPTVHPMIIDGVETMLIKADAEHGYDPSGKTQYEINGNTYYVDPDITSLKATNHRRSNLNLTKVVEGDDAPASATFPFTLVVDNAKVENGSADDTDSDYYVWFSIRDAEGKAVTDATVTGATKDGNYYYAPSGSDIGVEMKAGWNLRFTNLPTGTTYTFTEGDTDEFEFVKAENTGAADSTFSGDQTSTGTIEKYDAKSYEVTYTNKYVPETIDVTVEKIWKGDDENVRPASLDVQLLADGEEYGDPVTLTGDEWTYTWEGLIKNKEGKAIEYTVVEPTVPKGYHESYSGDAEEGLKITNEYEAEGEVTLTATKKLEGATLQDGQFTFELVDESGKVIQPAYNDADGNIEFEALKYDSSIFSNDDGDKAATNAVPLVRQAVADEADEVEVATTTVTDLDAPASEVATEEAATDETGEEAAAEITDAVEATEEAATDEAVESAVNETASALTTSESNEVVAFADGRSKTFTYTIREVNDGQTAITYDTHEITVTVTVTDKGDGTLDVEAEYSGEKQFVNTYEPEPVSVDPPVQKIIEGTDDLYNGGDFTFTISNTKAPEGVTAPMPENTSVTNSAEYERADMPGYYEFGEIEFTAAGTYVYKVTESGNVENVTNDPEAASGKTIEFTVTDNEGVLEVTPTTDEAVFTFTNTYSEPEPEPVKVALEGVKNLEGRDLVDGEFSFELRDADGKVVTTATNDADGNINFGTYTFEEEGTYTYTATEVQGSDEQITYDTSEQTFTIEVVANDKGGFDATVTCGDSYKAEFTNTYEKKEETPKTGDSNPFGTVLVLAGAAALALVSKKRLSLMGRD